MITISLRPVGRNWGTISFASTLYLCPILDLLLAEIPAKLQSELRLGLQEALVNAAKHGNNLDPSKLVVVRFSLIDNQYWWIISDQGSGFAPSSDGDSDPTHDLPPDEAESGRGLCLLHQIFDQVEWNRKGTELRLCKQLETRPRLSLRR
ncbi:anti-sigma regulatory factor (Ser/Thr protein kinase) [Cylindrospermum stagnale PCC 7417]|uniref:Anti-sigma regulatory factor (Ser/Thr protein kinase) n=1 Tax=Cylindrospermum stagnale PCC 7417 TaxID=56107 RepID=K9WSW9_9NOST|nr:anti-sigma regulatory factor [Cylindrospermum stagnale]AFZ22597.1 anti-sigma regulatory factor (Ser/Thr protein kinase) [Cylindrospermum stagnale PCC 7417]